jgi:hypothetical protein
VGCNFVFRGTKWLSPQHITKCPAAALVCALLACHHSSLFTCVKPVADQCMYRPCLEWYEQAKGIVCVT